MWSEFEVTQPFRVLLRREMLGTGRDKKKRNKGQGEEGSRLKPFERLYLSGGKFRQDRDKELERKVAFRGGGGVFKKY